MVDFEENRFLSGRFVQVLAAITGSLTALSDGMQYGWTSPTLSVLLSPSSPVVIEEGHIVWLENLYMLGGLAGLPLTIYLLDKFGRKRTMLLAAVENLTAWVILGSATSLEMLFFARFLAGVGADVNFVAAPMYVAEISDKTVRGRLGSVIYLMMLIGIILIYCVGPFVSIAVSSTIGASFIIIQLITFSFMPLSPYYLLVKNRKEDARKALQVLRNAKDVEIELNEIADIVLKENQERDRPLDLLRTKSYRKAFIIMTILNFGQHFGGISVMLMNIHMILEDATSIISTSTAAIIFSILMVLSCATSATLIDNAGRRFLLWSSSFLSGIGLLFLASYFAAKNYGLDMCDYNWVPVFAVMFYAVTFKWGLGVVPIVMTAELYPTNIKAVGCVVSDAMYIVAGGISIYLFHVLHESFGLHVPFFLFGFCCFFVGLFTILFVPETKGRTLDEVQQLLKGDSTVNKEKTWLISEENLSHNLNYGSHLQ
ncbi:hypothetical protein FQA39_LY10138 [Lamprigera yunnana]|nr:hypothetical protein FQA39_LY10138 [Lamprigera yunnana]